MCVFLLMLVTTNQTILLLIINICMTIFFKSKVYDQLCASQTHSSINEAPDISDRVDWTSIGFPLSVCVPAERRPWKQLIPRSTLNPVSSDDKTGIASPLQRNSENNTTSLIHNQRFQRVKYSPNQTLISLNTLIHSDYSAKTANSISCGL